MRRPWTDQDDTPLMSAELHERGTGAGYQSTRYVQGRWLARFLAKLGLALLAICVVAAIVAGVIAMFSGVQG